MLVQSPPVAADGRGQGPAHLKEEAPPAPHTLSTTIACAGCRRACSSAMALAWLGRAFLVSSTATQVLPGAYWMPGADPAQVREAQRQMCRARVPETCFYVGGLVQSPATALDAGNCCCTGLLLQTLRCRLAQHSHPWQQQ